MTKRALVLLAIIFACSLPAQAEPNRWEQWRALNSVGNLFPQIVGLQQLPVVDYLGYPDSSITNPSSGRGRWYYSTTDSKMHCLNSDGSSCAPTGSGGTVTQINTTSPITGGPITTTGTISCPTCTTSAAAITNNVLAKGSGGAQGLANSSVTDNGTTVSSSELVNFSGTGAASTSPFLLNGTPFTSGTGTTNFPYMYLNFGAAPSSFSTGGVLFGINAPSGFLGNVIEEHLNGGSAVFSVSQTGAINTTATISAVGVAQASKYQSSTNCSSSASPAVCAAASMGTVNIAATATTVTVNTTAVTANSEIMVVEDSSLGTKLGVTCNTTIARTYAVTARTAATSFVITASAAPVTNPACLSYWVMN